MLKLAHTALIAALSLTAVALVTTASVERAHACKTATKPLHNLALVQAAPTIVVATARIDSGGEVTFKVQDTLKGAAPASPMKLRMAYKGDYGDGDPKSFAKARRGAYKGSCRAYDFKSGTTYVLMLKDGGLTGTAFSRSSEVATDAWVAAVRAYLTVAALPANAQPDALRALAKDTANSAALREDAARIADALPDKHRAR